LGNYLQKQQHEMKRKRQLLKAALIAAKEQQLLQTKLRPTMIL
jgi:hypothetical protein